MNILFIGILDMYLYIRMLYVLLFLFICVLLI